MIKRSPEETIILLLCAICMLGLFPFALLRLINGELIVAAVDAIGFIGTALTFWHVYQTRRIDYAGFCLAALALAGMTLNVYMLGARDIYFFYPVVIMTYLLTTARRALLLTTVSVVMVSFELFPIVPVFEFTTFIASLLGCMLFAYVFASQRNRQRDLLLKLSTEDALTGAGNRRALHARLELLVASYQRVSNPMSLIILDLDNFKQINDRDGHLAGDEVLKMVATTISSRIRVTDNLYRYGGDEFIVLASDADLATALKLADDIRRLIVADARNVSAAVTVSLGVAQYQTPNTPSEWISRADGAMYDAKLAGKNVVASGSAIEFESELS